MIDHKNFNIYYENMLIGNFELNKNSNVIDLYKILQSSKDFSDLSIESIDHIVNIKNIYRNTNLWEQINKSDSIKVEFNIGYCD
jgi:hypothetical protein